MAVMRPAPTDAGQLLEPLDSSTLIVAEALRTLDDGWTIYTRSRLGLDIIDFLAVHDQLGVCAITALDWAPGTRQLRGDGTLHAVHEDGTSSPVADSPRFAAHRHRNNIYDRSFALPSDGTEPTTAVRAAVIAPQLSDAEASELLDPRHHHDSQQHVEVWGGESLSSQLERIVTGIGCVEPLPQSIFRVRRLIAPSERATQRATPVPRSANTYEVEVNPDDMAMRRFQGAAGSGKSFGLAARAARLAAQGNRVLLLSFNVTLANRLSSLVADRCAEYGANPTGVTCTNFHSYCTRVVQDAEIAGFATAAPKGARWTQAIVAKALTAFEAGFDDRYDAVLVDEGQDFTLRWWNMLREHALVDGGEMVLMVDPTLDLYERDAWTDEAAGREAGFSGPWIDLVGSYRMPNDLTQLAGAFASGQLGGDRLMPSTAADHDEVAGPMAGSTRRWYTIDHVGETGIVIGLEVVRLLRENPTLSPGDVAFICDYHHDGVAAAREIEAAGYQVHHIFSRDPDDARRRRKYRFSPVATAVKGSTIHSFKGWDTPALVMGIGVETRSKRVAYAAMTRVVGSADRPAVISVVCADKRLDDFRAQFVAGSVPTPTAAPAPRTAAPPPPPPAAPPAAVPTPAATSAAPSSPQADTPATRPDPSPSSRPAQATPTAPVAVSPSHAAGAAAAVLAVSNDAEIAPTEPNRPLSEPTQPDVVVTSTPEPSIQSTSTTPPTSPAPPPPPTPPAPPTPPTPPTRPAPTSPAAPVGWDAPVAGQRRG